MWFDKSNPLAVYADKRNEVVSWDEGKTDRRLEIRPDVLCDFSELPFRDETFCLVVFDPPHMNTLGENSRTARMYGKLFGDWESDLSGGFAECFRVLKPFGTLIFKWCSTDIPISRILRLTPEPPLFGHLSGRLNKTHWVTFMKYNKPFQGMQKDAPLN